MQISVTGNAGTSTETTIYVFDLVSPETDVIWLPDLPVGTQASDLGD